MSTIQTAIRAEPARVWEALTDGAITPAYYYGFTADYRLEAGAPTPVCGSTSTGWSPPT